MAPPSEDVRVHTLDNGLRVLSERLPGVRSVAVGVWVVQGGAHETAELMGESHLLEHMLFKGTRTRSPREIALALESLGGSLDAYTAREHTAYQARILDVHLADAVEVLADLTLNPLLLDRDLALERDVVLEEISAVEDTPDDLVFDLHGRLLWGDHGYGHPILGTRASVGGMTGDRLRHLHARAYRARNLVVAAAGNLDHRELAALAERYFGSLEPGAARDPVPPPEAPPVVRRHIERESAQAHIVLGARTIPHDDPRRYAMVILSQALGGGMSSRLFQRVREELALAYSVYTYHSFYRRGGVFGVYVGTRPEARDQALEAVVEELDRVAREGLPGAELDQVREQVKGQVTLSLESTAARLYRLAGTALNHEPWLGLDGLLARYDQVTAEEVAQVAATFLRSGDLTVLSLGPGAG